MKHIRHCIWLLIIFGVMACGTSGGEEGSTAEPAVRELQVGETQTNFIAVEGEVDTYHLRAAETNRFLHIYCEERVSGSGVDLLVTVFEEINGQRVRIFGKHKPDGATLPAGLDLWIYIDRPKDLYITVRDLLDDDASIDIPYYLRANFQDSAEGNHDFSNAQAITVGAAGGSSDAIDEIGEVDCFTFTPESNGVYAVDVAHHKPSSGSAVQLAISLYDRNGNRIQRMADPYHTIMAYLEQAAGPYFVIVEDSDSMDADTGAPYDIAVAAVAADEAQADDVAEDAAVLENTGGTYTAQGAIAYGCSSISPEHAADADWYRLTINEGGTYQLVQLMIDHGQTPAGTTPLRVTMYDSALQAVAAHDYAYGDAAYQNQFRIENGEYFISVIPANSKKVNQSTTYRVQLQLADTEDDAEQTDDNTANTARDVPDTGFVSYHSDVDWYKLGVTAAGPQILSVDLTSAASVVDYQLSIWRGDQMIKKISDLNGSDGDIHLKTSILVPANSQGTTYHFKVCDGQSDEGSSIPYTITASLAPVAGDPGPLAGESGTFRYYSETDQEPYAETQVELEIFSTLQPTFKANTTWLDFRNDATPGVTKTLQGDGTTVITFPWISGYADYQGDRDLFEIDFGKLGSGTETNWYYDVEVHLVVPSPGTSVEYVWKLYHDTNLNHIIMDNPTSPDGYKACAGDITPQTVAAIDSITPDGGETFWIGSEWGQNAKFYLGISDFNYLRLPGTEAKNPDPDDDWGYDAPYYITLRLTYHPNLAHPD